MCIRSSFAWGATAAALMCVCSLSPVACAQGGLSAQELAKATPKSWVEAASALEVKIIDDDGSFPLRYIVRKVDAKGDTTRDVIESREGGVARMIKRDGRPLTQEEDDAERKRLLGLMDDPSGFAKHHKRDNQARGYSMQLVREMTQAMLFTYTPGQPQWPNPQVPQVVVDFTPDPNFHPPNMVSNALTGVAGRIWINVESKRVVRIEGRILKPVDFGYGMLARIYPGGTIEFMQDYAGGDRWAYSHLRENLTIREMMFKTAQQKSTMDAADFKLLPAPLSLAEAIHTLLDTPLPK